MKMSPSMLSVALLLFCISLSPQVKARPPTRPFPLCCETVSSADVRGSIIGNPEIQQADGRCVHAIMFSTREREKLCVDPNVPWVQSYIE